jgi:NhaA family Na+:H+ antiporter
MPPEKPRESGSLPTEPIHLLTRPLARFLHVEAASGLVLLAATLTALAFANSPWAAIFQDLWSTELGVQFGILQFTHPLKHWINDGLMVVFFFVIGLEVKHELVLGELREFRRAAFPVAAAMGGMAAPAAIYLAFQFGEPGSRGWGIPVATDIAFVVGCLALLGSRVPNSLRAFMLSLAIADDVGAIVVIAVGYSHELQIGWLCAGIGGFGLIYLFRKLGVRSLSPYVGVGLAVWVAFHESGIHATIAGVILGLMTPTSRYLPQSRLNDVLERASDFFHGGDWGWEPIGPAKVREFRWVARETLSPLEYLVGALHPWVSFGIMPLFALANAGVAVQAEDLASQLAIAIVAGLVVGKPLGIIAASWLAVKLNVAALPPELNWRIISASGVLAGIGFTMSLFIAGLALGPDSLKTAKVGILAASFLAAFLGMLLLVVLLPRGSARKGSQPRESTGSTSTE